MATRRNGFNIAFGGVKNTALNSSESAPPGQEHNCNNCLQLSDVIIEYSDQMEEYYVADISFNQVAAVVASLLVSLALIRVACCQETRKGRENLQGDRLGDDDSVISMVDLTTSEPYRDGEVL